MPDVDLGFLEPCEDSNFLLNIHFPSKVGGRPAWLDLENVPLSDELKCATCGDQRTFLLQVYASLEKEEAFHRTIYLFVCPNESCNRPNDSSNFLVLRNQIPRKNPYYDFHPVPEDAEVGEAQLRFKLCSVCGCRGPFSCAKCKKVSYCSKGHQKIDWKAGHKDQCGTEAAGKTKGGALVQFSEFEIVLEAEEEKEQKDESPEDPEKLSKELEELKKYETDDKASLQNLPESELSKFTEEEDKFFSKFRKRISGEPEQVLRYDREGEPLWMAEENRLTQEQVEKCPNCKGERVFEFQVMPQLLNTLKSDSLDWGILAIYTCKESCGSEGKYLREFVHKQDIVSRGEEATASVGEEEDEE